jgi:GH24 family phage-related lysozyme (muramidase)
MPKTNAAGLALIEQFEGCELHAYQDSGGVWTIGYGHTDGVHAGQTITQAEADALLQEDVTGTEIEVQNLVEIELTPNEFAALVSFEFNTGALASSPGLALLNADKPQEAWDDHFCLYIRDANGTTQPGLVRRRAAERALFFAA